MMNAPHGAQRYASARWAAGPQRKFIMFREPPPSLATTCNVLPRIPLAALFDGAAFTHPRDPQNWRNNAVRTKFTMRDLPQPPPPRRNTRRIPHRIHVCRFALLLPRHLHFFCYERHGCPLVLVKCGCFYEVLRKSYWTGCGQILSLIHI